VKSHDVYAGPATVLSVTKKRLWVIAGVIGAASVAAVPAISAQAYPPDNDLTVIYDQVGPHTYNITAKNVGPGCTFRVVSGKVKINSGPVTTGTVTLYNVDIGTKTGTRVILAKTISCKTKETTTKKVTTTTNQIKGPSSAKQGEKITLKALGWNPDERVVITISNDKGPVKSKSLKPNSTGNVFWKTTTPPPGTYAVTFTQQGPPSKSQSYKLTINPKKSPKKH
jgi:hypothetical protein